MSERPAVLDKLSNSESQTITKEQANFREAGGVPGRRCGDCYFYEASRCTRGIVGIDKVDADDICDEYRPALQDGSLSTQEAEVLMNRNAIVKHLYITRVAEDKQTGERRWFSTSSGIKTDLYGERMSLDLFRDFIERAEKREIPPAPFTSKAWNGGLPYLGVAHYLDLNGYGIVGDTVQVYIDGTHFKARGIFKDSPVALKAYQAIRRDEIENIPHDERIRISIAFVDWGHEHEGVGYFKRRSLLDRCPYCERGIGGKIYREGQLVHLALTRNPAYEDTFISTMLEERSMKSKIEDAASIIGEDEAEEFEKRSKKELTLRSDAGVDPSAIVVRADEEDEEEMAEEEMTEEEEEERKKKKRFSEEREDEEEAPDLIYDSLAGAKSLDEADAYLEKSAPKGLMDSWGVLASVLTNIAGEDNQEAIFKAVSDFQSRLDVMALRAIIDIQDLVTRAKGETAEEVAGGKEVKEKVEQEVKEVEKTAEEEVHPFDEAVSVLRTAYAEVMSQPLSAEERLKALQEPLNGLAEVIRTSASTPIPDGDKDVAIVKALQAVVAELGQVRQDVASMKSIQKARDEVGNLTGATRRSVQLPPINGAQLEGSKPKTSSIRAIARRSVGLNE